MKISINGEESVIEEPFSISALIAQRKINPEAVVVEYNGVIINCRDWETVLLKEKDRLEIVSFAGGG